ncbi:MAG TPA: hypothetical protein VGP79_03415 [Bryobacteraceae bacterium]|jgi:hypothetical protein|nr:hypothetical protein [Bryobacteraceae bacterium]
MCRALLALLVVCAGLHADDAADLARAAKSPYLLKRYLESHVGINLDPLWTTVPPGELIFVNCESAPCTTELVSVQADRQVILVVNDSQRNSQAYLRFQRPEGTAQWRITGVSSVGVKYFPPRHRLIQFGNKPFFCATGQGAAGSGLSTEWESCYDLTAKGFEPAFEYSPKGNFWTLFALSIKWSGTIISMDPGPVETIRICVRTEFSVARDETSLPLGDRTDMLVYSRRPGTPSFKLDRRQSTISQADVAALFENVDFQLGDFLRWDLPALKRIAVGSDSPARRWLIDVLKEVQGPERNALATLIPK